MGTGLEVIVLFLAGLSSALAVCGSTTGDVTPRWDGVDVLEVATDVAPLVRWHDGLDRSQITWTDAQGDAVPFTVEEEGEGGKLLRLRPHDPLTPGAATVLSVDITSVVYEIPIVATDEVDDGPPAAPPAPDVTFVEATTTEKGLVVTPEHFQVSWEEVPDRSGVLYRLRVYDADGELEQERLTAGPSEWLGGGECSGAPPTDLSAPEVYTFEVEVLDGAGHVSEPSEAGRSDPRPPEPFGCRTAPTGGWPALTRWLSRR